MTLRELIKKANDLEVSLDTVVCTKIPEDDYQDETFYEIELIENGEGHFISESGNEVWNKFLLIN